jgi:hypothetical protein
VVTAACFFVAGGPWVRPSPGIPCALSILEGRLALYSSGVIRRENADVHLLFECCLKRESEARPISANLSHFVIASEATCPP